MRRATAKLWGLAPTFLRHGLTQAARTIGIRIEEITEPKPMTISGHEPMQAKSVELLSYISVNTDVSIRRE